jgi:hypothetical protein
MKQTLIALTVAAAAAALGIRSAGHPEGSLPPDAPSIRAARDVGPAPADRPVRAASPAASVPARATSPPVQARREAPAAPAEAPSAPPPGVVFVANTGGEGVFVRWTPSLDDKVKAYPDGTRLEVVGPETAADGITWRYVRAADGLVGWVPKQYTAVEPPVPTPRPG